jgi:hypothetical protein
MVWRAIRCPRHFEMLDLQQGLADLELSYNLNQE